MGYELSVAVMDEYEGVMPAGHYSAILSRNPSTSSRMFKEKNLGNSVDDGVRDNGGMCRKAFLGGETNQTSELKHWPETFLHFTIELKHHIAYLQRLLHYFKSNK